MPEVRQERTGWRDSQLSERHRRWGWDCPMVDVDFLAIEYDAGEPAALVEYKNEHAQPQYATHPSYQAMIRLGDRAALPVLAVRYADDFSWFRVTPLNGVAKKFVGQRAEMSEQEYVALLYRMRGREMPASLFEYAGVAV